MSNILSELNKRNVTRVAVTYTITGWVLAQVASTLEGALGLPDWFDTAVVVALLLGFPLAVVFAWIYELTPDGLVKATELGDNNPASASTAKKLDIATIAAVLVLVGIIFLEPLITGQQEATPTAVSATATETATTSEDAALNTSHVPEASIAVLPFADMSPQQDQEYFSDGLTEELLNVLTRVPGLKVAGRTSAFAFKGRNEDLVMIAETLRVAHILEGSVRKAGDTIRVTAQLIKADTGFHLWSKTYDRTLVDVFAIQDEISSEILRELSSLLTDTDAAPDLAVERTSNLDAYDLYLLAGSKLDSLETEKIEEAIVHLDDALELDPTFAKLWFARASAEMLASDHRATYGTRQFEQAARNAKAFIDRGFELEPDSALGKAVLGVTYFFQREYEQAAVLLREAQAQEPGRSPNNLAVAEQQLGNARLALKYFRMAAEIDPLNGASQRNYIGTLINFGRREEAEEALAYWEDIGREGNRNTLLRIKNNYLGYKGQLADRVTGLRDALQQYPAEVPLKVALFEAYMDLGLYDEAAAVDIYYAPLATVFSDPEGAIAFTKKLIREYSDRKWLPSWLLRTYINSGRWEAAEMLLPQTGQEKLLAECDYAETPWFPLLHSLYQRRGDDAKRDEVLRCRDKVIAKEDASGLTETDYAFEWKVGALADRGDFAGAVELVRSTLPSSKVSYDPLNGVVNLGRYRDQSPEIRALERDVIEYINSERAKLGYGPMPSHNDSL